MKIFLLLLLFSAKIIFPASKDKSLLFTNIPIGARAEALANTTLTHISDPSLLYHNPAALTNLKSVQMLSGYIHWLENIKLNFTNMCLPTEFGGIGIDMTYLKALGIEGYDINGNNLQEDITVSAMRIGFSIAKNLSKYLSWGATVKLLTERLDKERVILLACDTGQLFKFSKRLLLATTLNNLSFMKAKFYKKAYPLSLVYKIGVSYLLDERNLFFLVFKGREKNIKPAFGLEHKLKDFLYLRIGYDASKYKDLASGISCGLGLCYKSWQLNFSYTPFAQFNDVIKVDINFIYR
jgi:hypothetical protein